MSEQKNNLAQNLQFLLQHYGLTETEVSRRTQVGQPVIHRMLYGSTDNPKIKTISPVANLFGLSITQLLTTLPPENQLMATLSDVVISGWHPLPLVSLSALVQGLEAAIQKSRLIAHTDIPISDDTYAIQLTDNTMTPQFPEKTLCIIEPGLLPENEDFAVMVLPHADAAVFRKLLYHGDDRYLQAGQDTVPTQRIDHTAKCLGTMIQARIDLVS